MFPYYIFKNVISFVKQSLHFRYDFVGMLDLFSLFLLKPCSFLKTKCCHWRPSLSFQKSPPLPWSRRSTERPATITESSTSTGRCLRLKGCFSTGWPISVPSAAARYARFITLRYLHKDLRWQGLVAIPSLELEYTFTSPSRVNHALQRQTAYHSAKELAL